MKNTDVIVSFMNNKHGQTKSIWTDGIKLYSYGLMIGFTKSGKKYVYDYTAAGSFKSNTTSKHVKRAHKEGSILISAP